MAGQLVRQMLELGLSLDEAVSALDLAAKAGAPLAASARERDVVACITTARELLDEAFAQDVRVVVNTAANEGGVKAGDNSLLATARRRQSGKLHIRLARKAFP